jgi:hypothetical protein
MGGKPKMLWHDTETSGLPSYSSGSFPHFTVDPQSGHIWQHIPVNRAARALKNLDGGCQTNRWNVIQVEVIGYVNTVPYHSALGKLAAWAKAEHGVPATSTAKRLRYDASYGNTSVRFSCGQWDGYSGHLYHMSAPENDHGDPGDPFPMDQILAAAGGGEEDDLPYSESELKGFAKEGAASALNDWDSARPKNLSSDTANKPLTMTEVQGVWGTGIVGLERDMAALKQQMAEVLDLLRTTT